MFWPFTVWTNCSSDIKIFANSQSSASNSKRFSQSLEQFFLTVGQNNFRSKIPFLVPHLWPPKPWLLTHPLSKQTNVIYLFLFCRRHLPTNSNKLKEEKSHQNDSFSRYQWHFELSLMVRRAVVPQRIYAQTPAASSGEDSQRPILQPGCF